MNLIEKINEFEAALELSLEAALEFKRIVSLVESFDNYDEDFKYAVVKAEDLYWRLINIIEDTNG